MKISATVALAVIASAELATAKCFAVGWGMPTNTVKEWINFACTGNGGMFTGYYNPGQTKSMCPDPNDGYHAKVKIEVQNLNKNAGFGEN